MHFADMMLDRYDHLSENLIYSPSNLPGPGANLIEMESQLAGCNCNDPLICLNSDACQAIHCCSPNYSANKLLLESKWSSDGIVECNSLCRCPAEVCLNRVVQFGPKENLEVFKTGNLKGYGLRTRDLIPKGAFICEYAGEVIDSTEAKRRFNEISASNGMNYIFVLREIIQSSRGFNVIETIVDPSFIGNIGRYINHSCLPNAGILPVRVNAVIPLLGIFAKENIQPGEEVTFDYSGGDAIPNTEEPHLPYRKTCCCGSDVCKGFLPYDRSLH